MNAMTYDTHSIVKRLTGAGMPTVQAEAIAAEQAQLIESRLVTKDGLAKRVTNLTRRFDITAGGLAHLEESTRQNFAHAARKFTNQDARRSSDIARLESGMKGLESSMKADIVVMKWMLGVIVACIAPIAVKNFF